MKTIEMKEINRTNEENFEYVSYNITLNGDIIGNCGVMIDDNYAYCERIDINEESRNQGFGTQALEMLSEEFGGIIVSADNEDAAHLYERLGRDVTDNDDYAYIDNGYGVFKI